MIQASDKCGQPENVLDAWAGRPRVLVTEDDEDLLVGLRWMLRSRYDVTGHTSAVGALHGCTIATPDLLLIDYELPDLTGVDLLQVVRDSMGIRLPAIMISAHRNREAEARSHGFDAFLAKPLRRNDLLRAVEKTLGV